MSEPVPSPRPARITAALAAVLLAGALLRIAYLGDLVHDPLFLHPVLDAELHQYWANALATGDWKVPQNRHDPMIRTTPYFRPPGYPYALSLIDRLTGARALAVRAVQCVMGLASALLAFVLARRVCGPVAGIAAAALSSLYWPAIFFEGELLDSTLLTALLLTALLCLQRAGDEPTARRALTAGVLLGAAVLVRPNAAAVVAVGAVWILAILRRRGRAREGVVAAMLLVAGAALAVAPAAIRNKAVSGEWVIVSANGGINLWIGNNPGADGLHAAVPGILELTGQRGWTCFDYPRLVEGLSERLGRRVGFAEASRYWASQGWSWIGANPGRFAALTAKRAALFLGPREVGDRDVDLAREASPVLDRDPVSFPIVLALAVVGFAIVVARGRRAAATDTALLVATAAAAYAASFLPFFFNARYRVPVAAMLTVLAGVAIARGVDSAMRRDLRATVRVVIPVAALAAAASVDWVGVPRALDEWHYQRGTAFRDAHRPADAVREYRAALEISPTSALVRNDLALVLRDQGHLGDAVEEWNRALDADPSWYEARFNRAQVLAAQGHLAEAIPEYERVLREAPTHANAHLSLGTALLQTGRVGDGLAHYREAERLRPDDPLVAFVIGRGLLALGRVADGRAELTRALQIDPGYEPARRALAAGAQASPQPPPDQSSRSGEATPPR